jgi:hypothetical protein
MAGVILRAGLAAVNEVQTAYNAVQAITDALMAATPVGLVDLAIAVLAAGFVLAYNTLKPFHDAVNTAEEMDTIDQLVRSSEEHSRMAWDELHDAFAPVHSLIEGDTALVPAEVYERLRASKARVISSVSVVEAASPWAFFAIEGTEWGAPRWVYLDDETADPITDLAVIAQRLRARLAPGIADRPLDEKAAAVLTTFIERARKRERLLAGIPAAIVTVAALTLLSAGVARARLRETLPRLRSASAQGTQQPPS